MRMAKLVVAPVTGTSWRTKPTELNTSTLFSGTLRLKLPSAPVEVPVAVPFTSTVTPGNPSPLAPVTRPDTVTSATFGRLVNLRASAVSVPATAGIETDCRLPAVSSTAPRRKFL